MSSDDLIPKMNRDADDAYEWIATDTYQLLNHGINPASGALQCANCHGDTAQMDLQGELGYQLKSSEATVCSQCHSQKSNRGFYDVHERHVSSRRLECINCHTFSRPERGLSSGGGGSDD